LGAKAGRRCTGVVLLLVLNRFAESTGSRGIIAVSLRQAEGERVSPAGRQPKPVLVGSILRFSRREIKKIKIREIYIE